MHKPAVYPIVRKEVKSFSLPAGIAQFKQDNIFLGQLPSRVVIAMVDGQAFIGSLTAILLIFNCSMQTWCNFTLTASQFGRELFALEPGLRRAALSATTRCFVAWDVLIVIEKALSKWKTGREAIRCLHSIWLPMLTATTTDH